MTQVRWILAGALTLALSGLASAQSCPVQGTCPGCCQDCPGSHTSTTNTACRSVWHFVLRLGGVGIGVSAQPTSALPCGGTPCAKCATCATCSQPSKCDSCCDAGIYEIFGQCAPVTVQEIMETRTGTCGACSGCTAQSAVTSSGTCPCPAGACATACVPSCGSGCASQTGLCGRIVLNGPNPTFAPAVPVAVSRVEVQGNQVRISTPDVRATGERFTVTLPRTQSPLQISVKGKQVQIQTPTMQATCDRISALPTGAGQVLLEGNVRVRYNNPNSPAKIEARRILVDLTTNEFKIPQGSNTLVPAQRIGLWYAPSPMPMAFPPLPPMPSMMPTFAYPVPMPHPMPATTPVNRPVTPTGYYQPMPGSPR